MPTSSDTGITRRGSMPAAAVYTASLPTEISDAVDAPVADAEDLLGVGAHHQVHVVGPEPQRVERLLDVVRPVDGQVDPARAAVLVGVLLDRLADRRVVDDRQHLGEVVPQHLVVQHLVAVVQLLHVHVLGQIGRPGCSCW